jgi:hypothetical protein
VHCDLTNGKSFGKSEDYQQSPTPVRERWTYQSCPARKYVAAGASRVSGMSASTSKRSNAPTDPRNKNTTASPKHVRDIAGHRGTEGSANAGSDADHTLREIEMSGPACGVGDD